MEGPASVGVVVAVAAEGDADPDSNPEVEALRVEVGHQAAGAVGSAAGTASARPASVRPADGIGARVSRECGAAEALPRIGEAHTVQIAPRCAQVTGAMPPRTNVPALRGPQRAGAEQRVWRSEWSGWSEPRASASIVLRAERMERMECPERTERTQ